MSADLCPTWAGSGSEAAVPAAADADVDMQQGGTQQHDKQKQRIEGGVGYGGYFDMLLGSVSYDRTIKVWAPEEGLPDIIGDSDTSSGEGSGSEGEADGAMDLG